MPCSSWILCILASIHLQTKAIDFCLISQFDSYSFAISTRSFGNLNGGECLTSQSKSCLFNVWLGMCGHWSNPTGLILKPSHFCMCLIVSPKGRYGDKFKTQFLCSYSLYMHASVLDIWKKLTAYYRPAYQLRIEQIFTYSLKHFRFRSVSFSDESKLFEPSSTQSSHSLFCF